MRIGIMTFWWSDNNYGQLLQAYGLMRFLEDSGHQVELIRFRQNCCKRKTSELCLLPFKALNIVKLLNYVKGRRRARLSSEYEKRHPRNFECFRNERIHFTSMKFNSFEELRSDPPICDVLICGSDQVWNYFPKGEKGFPVIDAYTLQFGDPSTLRIAYAASMGFSGIAPIHEKRLISNLQSFSGISVRERDARFLLERNGIDKVEWVPDPTLLLGAEGFSPLIKEDSKYNVPFFVYALANKSVFTGRDVVTEVKKFGNQFEYTAGNGLIDKEITCNPTIEEWLGYMKNADTIITNSFHGCVFSILFQKNFYYYPLLPNAEGHKDSRIESLLDRLGIEGRMIADKQQLAEVIANPYKPIDWDAVKVKQDEFVQVGKDFLAKHLGEAKA